MSDSVLANMGDDGHYAVGVTFTSPLPDDVGKIPVEPAIDFAALLRDHSIAGRVDVETLAVINLATNESIPFVCTEDFAYSDTGRIQWMIEDVSHRRYEIRFRTREQRKSLKYPKAAPLIGLGDLLRYNAEAQRPVSVGTTTAYVDLNQDGCRDLIGAWIYGHDPNYPWDGFFVFPQQSDQDELVVGDPVRLTWVDEEGEEAFFTSPGRYMGADFADFDRDGLVDMVYNPRGENRVVIYHNSGQSGESPGGFPLFKKSGEVHVDQYNGFLVRAVDLSEDGNIDLVVNLNANNGQYLYLPNRNPEGLPFQAGEAVKWQLDAQACFLDIDGDGLRDAVGLRPDTSARGLNDDQIVWRRNRGGEVPSFDAPRPLDIDVTYPVSLAAVDDADEAGLFIGYDLYQRAGYFRRQFINGEPAAFEQTGEASSLSATVMLGDQPSPYICDWEGDGDWDLLTGHGYGWPRILVNEGSNREPAFAEIRFIESQGSPIRLLRNEILGPPHHGHNMGYPFPIYTDWDGDGLNDLILPNETNRIFWYANIGTSGEPVFGPQQQLVVRGSEDSSEARQASATAVSKQGPYPDEAERPFFWRTGAAVADFDGDGRADLATLDGQAKNLVLYSRSSGVQGDDSLLVFNRNLTLADGTPIHDALVGGNNRWAESFDAVDFDGDGLIDLVHSLGGMARGLADWKNTNRSERDSVFLLKNIGTATDPLFEKPRPLRCFGKPISVSRHGPHPAVGDVNGDGKPDLLTYTEWGVFPIFVHAALMVDDHPDYQLGRLKKLNP